MTEYFRLFDSVSTGIFIIDSDFKVVYWNSYVEDWTTINEKDILKKALANYFPAFKNVDLKSRIQTVFDYGTPIILSSGLNNNLLLPGLNVQAKEHVFEITVSFMDHVDNSDKKFALFTVKNETDLKFKITNLDRSRKELDLIFENSPISHLLLNSEAEVLKLNDATPDIYIKNKTKGNRGKLMPGEIFQCVSFLVGSTECLKGGECPECMLKSVFQSTLKTGNKHKKVEGELTVKTKDTTKVIYALFSTALFSINGSKQILVSMDDITLRKKAEIELENSKRLFETVLNTINGPVALKDLNLDYQYINKSAEESFGVPKEYLIGKSDAAIFDEEIAKQLKENDQKVINSGVGEIFEEKGIHKGKFMSFLVSKTPLTNTHGEITGLCIAGVENSIQKQLENNLKVSEEKYRLIADNISDLVLKTDLDFNPIYFSPSVLQMCGYTVDEALALKPEELYLPESLTIVQALIAKTKKQIRNKSHRAWIPTVKDLQIYKKDGSVLWVQISAHFVKNKNGNPTEIIGVARDISKQKEVEIALLENEKRFRTLFEKSKEPIVLLKGYDYVDCNNATLKALKINERNKFINLKPWDISPEFQPDGILSETKAKNNIDIAIENGYYHFDWEHTDTNGENIWFNISLTKIKIKDEVLLHAIWRNITKRKAAELILKDSEYRLKQIFETSQVGIVLSKKRKVSFVNEYLCNLLGYSYDEVINKSALMFYPSKVEYDMVGKLKFPELEKDGLASIVTKFKTKSGKIVDILMNSSFYNRRNEDEGNISVITDITYQKRIEESLVKVNKEKDRFISILAHDLINSLGGSIQIIELLELKGKEWDERNRFIELLSENSKEAYGLLANIVAWGKATLGKDQNQRMKISLREKFEGVKKLYSPHLLQKGITLKSDSSEMQFIMADSNMIDAILRNLVKNAIKFTDNGGMISLSAKKTKDFVEICIADTGLGMPKAKADNLFVIDSLQSELGTNGEKGTGLGLQIVKEYVSIHGGRIWVESKLNVGTKVFFTMPVALS